MARAWLAAAGLAGVAGATTYTVDDSGGADFTSIAAAIVAANPGDVLIVRAGQYDAFTLNKPLTLIGESGATVRPGVLVTGSGFAGRTVVVKLAFASLRIDQCIGPVVFDGVTVDETTFLYFGSPQVDVTESPDVRFFGSTIAPRVASSNRDGDDAIRVSNSRLELARCTIRGGRAGNFTGVGPGWGFGGHAVVCKAGSRVHVALSDASGGDGGDYVTVDPPDYGGVGGDALRIEAGADVVVAGIDENVLIGGAKGDAIYWMGGGMEGWPGYAARLYGGWLRYSGATMARAETNWPAIYVSSGSATVAIPPDPTLDRIGDPYVGSSVTLLIHGTSQEEADLTQGKRALVRNDYVHAIEVLTSTYRLHVLGFPGFGEAAFDYFVPLNMARGSFRVFQGREYWGDGAAFERTNSVPLVVR